MSQTMNPADWIDGGMTPPRRLPADTDAALAYLADTLGHVVYTRWTLATIRSRYASLADAKVAHPAVMRLLLDHPAVIAYWDRGRVRTAAIADAPTPEVLLQRVLHMHLRRFRLSSEAGLLAATGEPIQEASREITALATVPHPLISWLARAGRFVNVASATNTLGVGDDAQAAALFLRDRACRSPHTLRAYRTELRRLVTWCEAQRLGPLSDLTRHNLLAYRQALRKPAHDDRSGPVAEATQARALAVIASLFRYWTETGYLTANPAAGLVHGGRSRSSFAPQRMLPTALLAACDAWVTEATNDVDALVVARRRTIWTLYRYAGVRLVELVWSDDAQLPRLEVDGSDDSECWTLHVLGKGRKTRAIPLPALCVPILKTYRQLRGLPPQPGPYEHAALIHGLKGGSLRSSGLYDEVKAIFIASAGRLEQTDHAGAMRLRSASPHWLRHGYARQLVVEHQVPLPAAQALLGHASVQTTAGYAKTDLSQLRAFVNRTFSNS